MTGLSLRERFRPDSSAVLLQSAGYANQDIADLHASGIVAVDLGAGPIDQLFEVLGSDPPGLLSPHANWPIYEPIGAANKVVLVDYYTGGKFRPIRLLPCGIFGREGLLPPTASPASPPVDSMGMLRSRFNRILFRRVASRAQLDEEIYNLTTSVRPPAAVFFRGQTEQFYIERSPRIAALLYGTESAREPSLLSTAFRKRFSYVSAERYWKAFIADVDYRLNGFADKRYWVEGESEQLYLTEGRIARWHRISTMSLAQHYGLPTYGLDVTTSLDVAWWFATHTFHSSAERGWYAPHDWRHLDVARWPAIYVFRSTDWAPIDNLELPADRPRKQAAILAHGSWGAHGNVVADDLIAILALSPTVQIAPMTTNDVFPSDDLFYKELLALKARIGRTDSLYRAAGLEHVFEVFEL